MKRPDQIIVAPLITEKTTLLKEKGPVLAFRVDRRANKVEIRQAVEKVFNVKVSSVKTQSREGKRKRMGKFEGRRASWKKAVVSLAPGHKIELVEGV